MDHYFFNLYLFIFTFFWAEQEQFIKVQTFKGNKMHKYNVLEPCL
jgi:hypothetical protein